MLCQVNSTSGREFTKKLWGDPVQGRKGRSRLHTITGRDTSGFILKTACSGKMHNPGLLQKARRKLAGSTAGGKNNTLFAHYWQTWEVVVFLLWLFLFVWDDAKPQALAWQTLSTSKIKTFWRAFSGAPWQLAALPYSRAQQILAFIPAVNCSSLGRIHFTILKLTNRKASNILNWMCQNISFQYSAKLKCLCINRLSWFKKKNKTKKQTSHNTLACLVSV